MRQFGMWALTALCLTACTTFAPLGHVEYRRTTDDGHVRSERIVGLLACPTPRGNTVVLIPLYKASNLEESRPVLPAGAQRWLAEQPSQATAP